MLFQVTTFGPGNPPRALNATPSPALLAMMLPGPMVLEAALCCSRTPDPLFPSAAVLVAWIPMRLFATTLLLAPVVPITMPGPLFPEMTLPLLVSLVCPMVLWWVPPSRITPADVLDCAPVPTLPIQLAG